MRLQIIKKTMTVQTTWSQRVCIYRSPVVRYLIVGGSIPSRHRFALWELQSRGSYFVPDSQPHVEPGFHKRTLSRARPAGTIRVQPSAITLHRCETTEAARTDPYHDSSVPRISAGWWADSLGTSLHKPEAIWVGRWAFRDGRSRRFTTLLILNRMASDILSGRHGARIAPGTPPTESG